MIKLFDLSIGIDIKKKFIKEVENLIESKDFILGKELSKFEKSISQFLNVKYSTGVNSGTDAIEIALKAAGVQKNDKVIVPGFSFFATSEVVYKLGATPIFCDISKKDLCVDIEEIINRLDNKVKAIVPVHLFGNAAQVFELKKIQKFYNFKIIEDVAQAFGSSLNGKMLGSIGDFGCFSFYPTKNLGAFGDAGLVTSKSKKDEKVLKMLRNHGQVKQYQHEIIGYNSRLDTIQALILNEKLKNIDHFLKRRIINTNLYLKNFRNSDNVKTHSQNNQPLNLFPISFSSQKLKKEALYVLSQNNIQFGRYYPLGLNELPTSSESKIFLKNVDWATKNIVTLPVGSHLSTDEIDKISEILLNL